MESSQNKLYTINQAAEFLGVSKQTLRRWEKENKILPHRTLGNARRYSKKMLEEVKSARQYSMQMLAEIKKTPRQKTSILFTKQNEKRPRYLLPLLVAFFIVALITLLLLATYYLQPHPAITSPVP